ncbi:transcription factor HIVEP3 isoform X2 [Xenopus laevis]|uniref:Transcription factor HIVEP3 n=1 Tax=Xenopus laevis TaxID=8355 RepID=A0A8J1M883_XENLA|nr:transcription factor HIVEP3 isoform X2 [Xenopus laevis]
MEPEKSQKSTRKLEEGVRKRLSKEESLQGPSSPAGLPSKPQGKVVVQQSFQSSLKIPREGTPRRVGRPCKAKGPHSEQLSKAQTTSPAFMAPRAVPDHTLEGSTWQVVDPIHPGPSSSYSALHARITCTAEDASQKTYVHRPTEVSVKQGEEPHKKEKKPQKPGKYICQYCSRPCAKPSVLQKHIRSHTGERPYPCIPCGFSFKTKSNLYKHRKSHAHRIKAGLASETGGEMYPPTLEMEQLGGEEIDDHTEGESTDSEEETSTMASLSELSPPQKHGQSSFIGGQQVLSHELTSLSQPSVSIKPEEITQFGDPSMDPLQKSEDTHTIKQKLALRLSERKKASEEQMFLSPGSKGSTESGYFSRSESAEQQISPPNTNAKSYAEIILGKCGRIGQRSTMTTPTLQQGPIEEKPSLGPISVPRTQVIEHITKLITINEAVVDTSEIDSVKPRRSSLSRRSSIESPKAALYRDPFQFDPKCLPEKTKGEHSFLSLKQSHSATETVPLLRSHSMPSSACTISSPHPFRASYSFDDRIVEPEVSSQSHIFSSHPRLLKRQPAIELPLGMEYTAEECGSGIRDTPFKPSDDLEVKESELSKKSGKVGRAKVLYECNICGARYKKRGNYETHKKYYCSELQTLKPQLAGAQGLKEHEKWPHMLHYKVSPGLEQSTLRKRRIVKSPGDDEESQSFDMSESQATSVAPGSPFTMSDRALNVHSEPVSVSDIQCRMPALEGKEKAVLSKEISVIQHTSSFERSESMEQLSSFEEEDKPAAQVSLCSARQNPHLLQPKLVRQHNIQVPEILVTEEPDKSETDLEPPPKEQGKTEEFQWPQRSQTLSQLPAEKLPPKKKRLRLAEMTQSSGDSSFESMSLTRSPSQESSVSHASSHSVSFEREEGFKAQMQCQASESLSKSQGHHMLTVPSHHHHAREMRRSASEQTPNVSQTPQISENRSKSFDYGNLTFPAVKSSPTAQERRKCFSIRQTSLSKHVAQEPDLMLRDWSETEQPSSSSHIIDKSISYQSSVTSYRDQQSDSPQPKQTSKAVQEKACLSHQLPVLPHPPILPEQTAELFPTQPMTDILSAQFSLPAVTPSVFHTPPIALQHTLLHPDHFQIPQQLNEQTIGTSFRHLPPYVHLPYPGSSPFPPTFFIPVQPEFALPTSTEIGGHYSQLKSVIPSPIGVPSASPHKDFFSEALHCPSHSPLTTEPSSQGVTVNSDPVVSLVVPVRLQTQMPSIGSAMYTTLSQILVTHSHCSPSALVIQTFESQSEGSHGSNLAHILPQHQENLLQTPYLRVPFAKVETSHYMPLTSSSEIVQGLDLSSSSVGGSKRMLSPAGSLELTMETQQQKRVKEENVPEEEGHFEILKAQDEGRTVSSDTVVSLAKVRLEQLPSSQAIYDDSSLKDSGKSLTPPLAGSSHTKSPEEYKEQIYARKITVKAEHSEELVEPFSSYTSLSTRVPVNLCVPGGSEVTETKKVQTFPTLHTTTNVSWCYLNYVKPNHAQQTDRRASVYGSWCISLYNPNLPDISTRAALSLLRSKQKTSTEIYTTADTTHSDTDLLVPSRVLKPKMTEKEAPNVEKEEDKRGKQEDTGPTVRRSEPARIRIFEGGYKSNEEYVYVRGRGRGKYVCEECGIRCKKPSMLKKHIRTHTDLRPYVCKHCNFAFKTKGNLTKHMKSKAHSKKCQELGLLPPSLAELDAEEGTSDERWQDSDVVEEHQFSDFEDSDDDDEDSDEEDDEEEDEEESQEEKLPDPSLTVRDSPNEPTQDPETAGSSPAYQFSPNPFPTVEPPEKDTWGKSFDLPVSRDTLSCKRWSPGKEASGCSRPGPSRRHLLQKRESSPKCFSTTGCPSPRRGMSPCQRLASTKEVSPLRCISPRHLSPHRDLSPRTYMSPERGASPPVRHISPSRELTGLQCTTLRPGLASPPCYASPGRDEQQLSKSETQTHIKVQQGFFSSMALPHQTETACNKQKLGPSNIPVMSRPLCSQLTPHYPARSAENLFTHLPLHSQHLQRTPYPMIPIGGIQMVQARPSPHPALLGHSFFEPQPADPEAVPFEQQHQEETDEQNRTSRKKEEKDRVMPLISTAPLVSPSSTYCQTASTPPQPDMSQADTDPCHGEHVGEG